MKESVHKYKKILGRSITKIKAANSLNPLYMSAFVLLILTVLIVSLSVPFIDDIHYFFYQLILESYGVIFDLAIIGLLLFWVNRTREIRMLVRTYMDEIDDFRLWDSEEAAHRTVGNIKRLNRYGIHKIDLMNSYLVQTNLSYADIHSSNLNMANLTRSILVCCNLAKSRLNKAHFNHANLNQAILEGSFAAGTNFSFAFLVNCDLRNSFLIKANFTGSYLIEAKFNGAQLQGALFHDASLFKADLRGAEGLTVEQLSSAKTLQEAKLDEELYTELKSHSPHLFNEDKEDAFN